MLKVVFTKTSFSLPNFPYQISFIEFIPLKTFLLKPICTTNLHCVYLGPIFLELG